MFQAPEDAKRRKLLQQRKLLLDLEEENIRMQEQNRIKRELKNILIGTVYEEKTADIIEFISAKKSQGKKAVYTGALHQFGREDGRAIYRLLRGGLFST